jgi:aspartate carbamoyltransferase catalytic subunit
MLLDDGGRDARGAARDVKKLPTLRGRTVINLFFEDSTRTRSSFEIAGKWMSADTINITGKGSSRARASPCATPMRTIDAMAVDAIVMRHMASGAAHQVATVGRRQRHQRRRRHPRAPHPGPARRLHASSSGSETSTGKHVAIVGDLTHSRVFRSNAIMLRTLGARRSPSWPLRR